MRVTRIDVSRGRSSTIVAASVAAHALLLAVVAWRHPVKVAPVRLPGTTHGTNLVLTYLPGRYASSVSARQAPNERTAVRPVLRARPMLAQIASAIKAEQPPANAGAGLDALGEGDVSIALMQFFPDPKPDLSRLPRGSRGDVVLEAIIDAGGRIAQLTIKQGVGYGVDESVIATVQQWTFHPAMRDGKPVASQQEFHFHYERG